MFNNTSYFHAKCWTKFICANFLFSYFNLCYYYYHYNLLLLLFIVIIYRNSYACIYFLIFALLQLKNVPNKMFFPVSDLKVNGFIDLLMLSRFKYFCYTTSYSLYIKYLTLTFSIILFCVLFIFCFAQLSI